MWSWLFFHSKVDLKELILGGLPPSSNLGEGGGMVRLGWLDCFIILSNLAILVVLF